MTNQGVTFSPFSGMTERQFIQAYLRVCRSVSAISRLTLRKIGVGEVSRPKVPEWFEACFEAYWKAAWKNMPVGITEESASLYEVGYFTGYMRWFERWVDSFEATLAKLNWKLPKLSTKAEKRLSEEWERALIPAEIKPEWKKMESGETDLELEIIDQKLEDLPLPEAAKFHTGTANGLLGPSGSADASLATTNATAIYVLLMLWWGWLVEECPTITVLHGRLVRVMGRNLAGSKARLEKICERIGLRFRGRGRPKKVWPFTPKHKNKRRAS